jgi:hypothetical protein
VSTIPSVDQLEMHTIRTLSPRGCGWSGTGKRILGHTTLAMVKRYDRHRFR